MVPDFNIEVTRTHSAAVVRLAGELDLATAPRLRGEFIGLVDGGVRSVRVDLSEDELHRLHGFELLCRA